MAGDMQRHLEHRVEDPEKALAAAIPSDAGTEAAMRSLTHTLKASCIVRRDKREALGVHRCTHLHLAHGRLRSHRCCGCLCR
eukprot:2458105-Prymnesium_polylepis.1